MSIQEYCRRDVRTIGPDETAREAARRMDAEDVGCLVVVERGKVIGIVNDRDVALEILCSQLDAGAVTVRQLVRQLVRQPVVTLDENASLADAVEQIQLHGIRRLPVIGGAGELVGLVTVDDLAMLFVSQLGCLSDAVQRQLPPLEKK